MRELPETDPELIREFEEISASVDADRAIGNAKWSELLEASVFLRVVIGGILLSFIIFIIIINSCFSCAAIFPAVDRNKCNSILRNYIV